jgi:hypothetical protein
MGNYVSGSLLEPIMETNAYLTTAVTATATSLLLLANRKKIKQTLFHNLPMYILSNHRSAVVTVFGLPLSLLWNCALNLRSRYIHTFKSAPHLHSQRVETIV